MRTFFVMLLALLGGSLMAQTWLMQQTSPSGTGVTDYGTASGWNLGYIFQCNAAGVTVTHLGCVHNAAATRTVTLWDTTTQAVIGQVTTGAGSAGGWRSGNLASPVALVQGRQYIVAVFADSAVNYYGVDSTASAAWHPTSGPLQHIENRWVSTTVPDTFPTQTSGASYWHWGLADVGYNTGPSVTASTATLNLGSTPLATPSNAVSYTVSGNQLSAATVITAPSGVNVSFSQTTGFAQSIQISTTPSYTGVTVWARMTAATAGAVTGNITHTSTGATSANVAVNGTVTGPTVTPSVSSLNLGSTQQGTPSSPVSYTVSGSALTGNTVLTAPSGVEISFSSGSGYANSITITTFPTYAGVAVYARMTAATTGAVSGNITHASASATTVNVSVSGTVYSLTATPSSLNLGSTSVGTPGSPQSYNLVGAGLTVATTVTAPADFEISLTQTGTYVSSFNINQTPTLNSTIWVRLTGATLGTFNGNVTNAATPASILVPVSGSVTQPNNLALTRNGPGAATGINNNNPGPGGNGHVILDFTLQTGQTAWTATSIVFTASGTADEQTAMNLLGLYEDINTNGSFDGAGTDTLATAAAGSSFNGANGTYTATLTNGAWPTSTTRRFFLVCNLAGTAIAGQTIHAEVTTLNATTGGVGVITGVPSTAANDALFINPAVMGVTMSGPISFSTVDNNSQGAGSNGHVVCDFTFSTQNDTWTVSDITFTESGSMDGQTDVNFLALYLDNGNGTFDGPGTDTLATATAGTSFNAANGTYTATLTGAAAAFAMNQGKRFFLVAKLAGQASPAETLRVAVTSLTQSSPTGGTVSGTPTAASSALVIDVATLTVNAGPTNPTIVAREQNAAGFTVGRPVPPECQQRQLHRGGLYAFHQRQRQLGRKPGCRHRRAGVARRRRRQLQCNRHATVCRVPVPRPA